VDASQKLFDADRRFRTDLVGYGMDDLSLGCRLAIHRPGDVDHDDQERRKGKEGIVCQRRTDPRGPVMRPLEVWASPIRRKMNLIVDMNGQTFSTTQKWDKPSTFKGVSSRNCRIPRSAFPNAPKRAMMLS
jgi:hypothetical protein